MREVKSSLSRFLRLRYALFPFGKAFRAKEKEDSIFETPDMLNNRNAFTVIDEEGKEVVCNVLFTFDSNEGKHYIVYTDNTEDQDGNVRVYASIYASQLKDRMEVLPIETPEEWTVIEDILTDLQEKAKNGELIDSDNNEIIDEEEALESLPVIIWKKLDDWASKLNFPVFTLLPYIIGIVFVRLVCPNPLHIWAEIVFMLIELFLIRVSYDTIEDTHYMTSGFIILYLFIGGMMFLFDPLVSKLFSNTVLITYEPWGLRIAGIASAFIVLLRARLKKRKRYKHRCS